MSVDIKTLATVKSYVKQSLQGAGAVKGQKGDPGKDGKDGENGFSPHIQVLPISGGYHVMVTDVNGSYSFDIMNGHDGRNGVDGINGKDGKDGKDGIDGLNGKDGINGEQGIPGMKGDPGEKGERGDSFAIVKIYADSTEMLSDTEPVNNGFLVAIVDTDNALVYLRDSALIEPGDRDYIGYKYITNLRDATVIRGPRGEKGEQGIQGLQGEPGNNGIDGINGRDGKDGIDGLPGKDGKNGLNGTNGNDGITPHIDPVSKHWFIGDIDTGILAEGKNGKDGIDGVNGNNGIDGQNGITPHIGNNGNWFIDDTDTGVTAKGIDGENGDSGQSAYEIAVNKGFTGTVEEWLTSLKGEPGQNGRDGIDGLPGKDGKDGRLIQSITKDENENLIIVFSDGTTQNIGKLAVDISADFLTEDGFGNIRYYNGKFQAYQNDTWVDVAPTPDNTIVVNMMPNPMRRIIGIYDHEVGKNKLKWLEPDDTVVDGQIICVVDKVVIRRKLGSAPTNESDGDLVIEVSKKDFNSHNTDWYFDEGATPAIGDIYYYKAFPVSTTGFANAASVNEVEVKAKDHYLYGFILDQNESDPDSMVIYIEDNKGFSKAFMDYAADRFNYGDWQDTFIMPKPCMLNTNGTVAYYLDPDDYTKKADGTDSDVANVDFDGNAMNEWGKIFWKVTDNGDGTGTFLFSDKKVNDDFVYWSNIDENGDEIPHFYTPLYDGSLINGRLRSLSGQTPMGNRTIQQGLDYAHANNPDGVHMYETDVFCDVQLFIMLCVLISKTTDSQKAFGSGNNNSYVSESNTGIKKTGTMDKKGMFWGDQTNVFGVKVFGREHPYGNEYKQMAGWTMYYGTQKTKMTYGKSDGSTVNGYNITGDGYSAINDSELIGTMGGYISTCKITKNGLIPKKIEGSSTTKYCDSMFFYNNGIYYAYFSGGSKEHNGVGIFQLNLYTAGSYTRNDINACLSCKPKLSIQTGGES